MADHAVFGEGLSPEEAEAAAFEAGRRLFTQACDFVAGAASLDRLPAASMTEVAFAGRSNVGKSSLINALTGRNTLARTSNTPGRTQQLNFFDLGHRLMLVDLPGYGYAKAPKTEIARWTHLVETYLKGRTVLRRTLVLVDSRHGLKESDRTIMTMLDKAAQTYQLVLTKVDKVGIGALAALTSAVAEEISRRPAAYPHIAATSSESGQGIADLRAEIAALAAR